MLKYSETIKTTYVYEEVSPEAIKLLPPGTELYFEETPYSFICGGIACAPFISPKGDEIICCFGFDNFHGHESHIIWQSIDSLETFCLKEVIPERRVIYTRKVYTEYINQEKDIEHINAWNKK